MCRRRCGRAGRIPGRSDGRGPVKSWQVLHGAVTNIRRLGYSNVSQRCPPSEGIARVREARPTARLRPRPSPQRAETSSHIPHCRRGVSPCIACGREGDLWLVARGSARGSDGRGPLESQARDHARVGFQAKRRSSRSRATNALTLPVQPNADGQSEAPGSVTPECPITAWARWPAPGRGRGLCRAANRRRGRAGTLSGPTRPRMLVRSAMGFVVAAPTATSPASNSDPAPPPERRLPSRVPGPGSAP